MVLQSPSSVFCSYVHFHSVLNKPIPEENALPLFGWGVEHEKGLLVDNEVLQLYWEVKRHPWLLADINSLGIILMEDETTTGIRLCGGKASVHFLE